MSREHTPPHAKLPSLHEVLGDVLDQRPASRATSRDTSSTSSSRRSGVSSTVMRFLSEQPCLIPYHQHPSPSRSSSTPSHSHPPHPSAHPQQYRPPYHAQPQPVPQTPNGAPDHSFHLFSIVPEQGLVHQRSSTRDDLDPTMPKPRLPPQDPARKYVCSECGNRFSKQSTLRNHHLTHTGERPFACQYPGCGRRFSMACNMQRHMRTHTSASAFENPPPHAMGYDRASSTGSSREGSVPMAHSPNGHGRY